MRETIIEPRAMTRFGNAVDEAAGAHRGRTLLTERHQHIILWHVLNPNAPAISQCVREVQRKFQAEGMFVPSDPTITDVTITKACVDGDAEPTVLHDPEKVAQRAKFKTGTAKKTAAPAS